MMRPARTKLAGFTSFTSHTIAILLGAIPIAAIANTPTDEPVRFTDAEKRQILRHGPWPIAFTPDPSNRASGDRHAIELGEKLFFDRRLSPSGTVSCGSCHQPDLHWTDGERRASHLFRHLANQNGKGQIGECLLSHTPRAWKRATTP